MFYKNLLRLLCLALLGGLRLTTTTTTTLVAAMSIANQDMDRYFRTSNQTQSLNSLNEERIVMDYYNYAFLNFSYFTPEPVVQTFSEEKARYGEGRIFSVTGKLVHITDSNDPNDDTACSANILGTGGDATPASNVVWIALVRRGRCTFEEKVKNVYAKGALAIIIYNDKPVMNLEKMQIKGKTRNITAVITYQEIGLHMASIVDQGFDMTTSIIEGKKGSRPINTLNRTSVLFVSISFIILMIISLVWLIAYYIQRFRYLQTKDQQSRQLCSVTKKAIMKIPTKTGKICDEKDADSDCCAICIETYKPADCIRILPCKHEFHKNCIDPWLIEHRTCPMCKLDVLKFYGYVFLGSEESILEYEPARTQSNVVTNAGGNNANARTGALADLIRSRDFVIDFPRIFVLDGATTVATRESLFPTRLPERSQSTLSLAQSQTKDLMSNMTNKLDEQQGITRFRRMNATMDDMQEHLLNVNGDSLKKRRSRSADARYSSGYFGRREISKQQQEQKDVENSTTDDKTLNRRDTMRSLTEASYALSRQRQQEERANDALTIRRRSIRNNDNIQLRDVLHKSEESRESTPPILQINGEEVDTD